MSPMELSVERRWHSEACTTGILSINGTFQCFTLERPEDDPEHPPIPTGRYEVTRYQSPHFGKDVLLLHDVPGRDSIEIHTGNTAKDSHGCILVGQTLGGSSIGHSVAALIHLLATITFPAFITIEASYGL
jgi:hypothetical protein